MKKLAILLGAPLLLAIFFACLLIMDTHRKSQNAEQVNTLLTLAVANSELVHELQKERGLTSGFIATYGSSKFKKQLEEQQQKSNEKLEDNIAIFTALDSELARLNLHHLIADTKAMKQQLTALRKRVEQIKISVEEALEAYTVNNSRLLQIVSSVANKATSAELKQQALAYYNFIQAKERAGLERAMMSGVFAKNSFTIKSFNEFTDLILLQAFYLREFSNLATPQMLAFYEEKAMNPSFSNITTYRNIALKRNIKGDFGISASVWFDEATKRINELKSIEDFIANSIKINASDDIHAASIKNRAYIIMSLFLAAMCILFGRLVSKDLNTQVSNLVETIIYCADNNALNKELSDDRKDEFGIISSSLNRMLGVFKSAIENLATSSKVLASTSKQNTVTVDRTSKDIELQKENIYVVAAAIEEMTVSIEEVSTNTTDAACAADQAKTLTKNSSSIVNRSVEQIAKLNDDVKSVHAIIANLNENSHEIRRVIDVIKSVAEQINLLSLNAAIEAARAGEQGRGFAVVAEEVRTLALRTQDSTTQIETIITQFTQSTSDAFNLIENCHISAESSVTLSKDVSESLSEMANAIDVISDMSSQIAASVEEQSSVALDISKNLNEVGQSADTTAESSKKIASASIEQSNLANELKLLSSKFVF